MRPQFNHNYKAAKLNAIDVVIQVKNTKSTAELKKMLTKSNLPFKLNVQGSKLPSGLYIIAFGFNDNGFTNMATLAPIPDVWKDLDFLHNEGIIT